jgi:hypothetical protein
VFVQVTGNGIYDALPLLHDLVLLFKKRKQKRHDAEVLFHVPPFLALIQFVRPLY